MGKTNQGIRRLWQPGGETLDVIAGVLSDHWRAAARLAPTRTFWQAPARWLRSAGPLAVGTPVRYHFTSGGKLIR